MQLTQNSTSELKEITEPLVMPMQARDYQELVNDNKRLLEALIQCQDDLKAALLRIEAKDASNDFLITEALKASNRYREEIAREQAKNSIQSQHMAKMLDRIEAEFDTNEKFVSLEDADDYLTAARYQRDFFGRNSESAKKMIERVEEYVINDLPY